MRHDQSPVRLAVLATAVVAVVWAVATAIIPAAVVRASRAGARRRWRQRAWRGAYERTPAGNEAVRNLLGFEDVRNYDGSWTEWGSAVRVPIVTGSEPGPVPGR